MYGQSGNTYEYQERLVDPSDSSSDKIGSSEAISQDGKYIVGGATNDDDITEYAGALHAWSLSGNTYEYQERLVDSSGSVGDQLGSSVAISQDGNYIVGGAEGYDKRKGVLHVWSLSGNTYEYQERLVDPSGNTENNLGSSVAISRWKLYSWRCF